MKWITDYLTCTQHTIAPPLYRYWCGVACIAAALGRNVAIQVSPKHDTEGWSVKPNFYLILIGNHGTGKSVAIRQARSLLSDCGVPISADTSSRAQFFTDMDKADSEMAVVAGELGTFLHGTTTGKDTAEHDMLQALCRMFDLEPSYTYSTRGGANATLTNPFLSILGGTTPHALHRMLPAGTHGEGFLSRTLLICHWQRQPRILDARLDMHIRSRLLGDLRKMRHMDGIIKFDADATAAYSAWNDAHFEATHDSTDEIEARAQDYVVRLAAVHAAADMKKTVRQNHVIAACENIEAIMPSMQSVLRMTFGNPMSPVMESLQQRLTMNGEISESSYYADYRAYGTLKQLEATLALLKRGHLVKVEDRVIRLYGTEGSNG